MSSIEEMEQQTRQEEDRALALERERMRARELIENKPEITSSLKSVLEQLTVLVDNNPVLTKDAAGQFIRKFQDFRTEDQKLIIDYLTRVTTSIVDFVKKYEGEMVATAELRVRTVKTLDLVDAVLSQYR